MRHCKHVNLMVPATTEIVIEGRFIPNERRDEGPFGEFMSGPAARAATAPGLPSTSSTFSRTTTAPVSFGPE